MLHSIRASAEIWRRCAELFLTRRAIRIVAQEAEIGHSQAEKIAHLFRVRMCTDVPEPFTGTCEADETFIGGQWKNKRRSIRRRGTKKGHGTTKAPIVGVLSREAKQVRVTVLSKRTGIAYWTFIRSCLAAGTILYTDGYKMNRGVARVGIAHAYVDHHRGEFVRGDVHTNGIEGFWGYLKRHLATVGGIRRDRLPLFVGEFVWRYNHRHLSLPEQCTRLLELLSD